MAPPGHVYFTPPDALMRLHDLGALVPYHRSTVSTESLVVCWYGTPWASAFGGITPIPGAGAPRG